MASITLDRTRHFGQIFGQTENGAVFTQDGIDFRGDGTAILTEDMQATIQAVDEALEAQQASEQAAAPKAKNKKAKADTAPESSDDEDLA